MPVFYINSRTKYGKNVLVGMSAICLVPGQFQNTYKHTQKPCLFDMLGICLYEFSLALYGLAVNQVVHNIVDR